MSEKQLRERIAFEAARLLHDGHEIDYVRAKRRGARKLGMRFRPDDLPSNREIRDQLDRIEQVVRSEVASLEPRKIALESLRLMRQLRRFHPRLLNVSHEAAEQPGQRVEIRFYCDTTGDVVQALNAAGIEASLGARTVSSDNSQTQLAFVDAKPSFPCTLTVAPEDWRTRPAFSPRTGGPVPSWTIPELEAHLAQDRSPDALDAELEGLEARQDRFEIYRSLLLRLEDVKQDPRTHPEGDALYHSLQVFDLACRERPYDEEFLTAALLHDVGKAANLRDHTAHTHDLLEGLVTRRTEWLIANLPSVRLYRNRELPHERRRELVSAADFSELLLLGDLDVAGRQSGVVTSTIDHAIDLLRSLDNESCWKSQQSG